jgi:hypothetical protein
MPATRLSTANLGLLACLAGCGRLGFSNGGDASVRTDLPPLTYRDAVIADAPLGYWRLADTGVVAHDEMGQFDGSIIGTCTTTPGALAGDSNAALMFDGTSCMIALGDHFSFAGNAPYSIEAWYTSVAGGDAFRHLFTREQRNDGPLDGYALALDDNGGATTGVFAERVVASAGTSTMRVEPAAGFSHAVAVYDGAELSLFVNGVAVSIVADIRPMSEFASPAFIGAAPDLPRNNLYHGVLDEVAIYDHALSAARITLHFELGAGL